MSKSEIFDSFIKIAQEKGMISEDAPEKAKKKLSKDHRADSLDISAIEALYGTKPPLPKGMEYDRNIIEDAHPNSVVISPSYDKLNGLVENNNERQNIILNILKKTPDGHLTQHKYAEKDFVMNLVRLGNLLDTQKEDSLRVLADKCLEQATAPKFVKKAFGPLALAGIVAIPIITLYVQQHMSFINEGFQKNHEKLMAEVDDLLNSESSWGVGNQYTSDFKKMVGDFKNKLTAFYNLYQKVLPIIQSLEKPRTGKELAQMAAAPQTANVIKAYNAFRNAADNMLPYIETIEKDFSSESYKNRQTEDKGFFSSLIDKTQVLHGGKGLVADDFDDVARAIPPYKKSIKDILDVLKTAESLENNAKAKLQEAAFNSQKEFGDAAPSSENAPSSLAKDNDFDTGVNDLEKDLTSGLL